jgi:hypothetical protein
VSLFFQDRITILRARSMEHQKMKTAMLVISEM